MLAVISDEICTNHELTDFLLLKVT